MTGSARRRGAHVSARTLLAAAGIVVIALLAVLVVNQCATGGPAGSGGSAGSAVAGGVTPRSGLPTIAAAQLPAQATAVLALVDRGGPFPYAQDGTVFSNREGLLPKRPSGYYREYTVTTPGSPDRGARRLIVGRAGDVYYTNDHYESFRQVIR